MSTLRHLPGVLALAGCLFLPVVTVYGRDQGRPPPLDESGGLLIICHDAWLANVQPLADHKNGMGIPTTVVPVSAIGNDVTAIKAYIQSVYDTAALSFVLLVGDAQHVATPHANGAPADPVYAKVAGLDDYPDIMVGRFSAGTAADVDTQVQRTIEYELMPATQQEWFWQAAGIGADAAYLDGIRDALLAGGYTEVDRLYDPGVTPGMIATALNDGRGMVNYVGHATATSWSTGPFAIADVNALDNAGMLPFIFSVASLCGDFEGTTCLGEAWLRAHSAGGPAGAVAAYVSAVSQYWAEARTAHQEFIALYLEGAYHCFGTLCYAAGSAMIAEYGAAGAQMFDGWIVFGDPSLRVVGAWQPPTRGDLDCDGDVDLNDFATFALCYAGTAVPPPAECEPCDLDEDDDVDLADFATFALNFTG